MVLTTLSLDIFWVNGSRALLMGSKKVLQGLRVVQTVVFLVSLESSSGVVWLG